MSTTVDNRNEKYEAHGQARNLRIIFLHHSTGRNLIRQGRIRDLIDQRNMRDGTRHEFWDHDYNKIGLTGPSGIQAGVSFDIPDDNTDPDGLGRLFKQPVHEPPNNALSHLLSYDVVIFKSCFPVSAIGSQRQLEQYKARYLAIHETLVQHPSTLFIAMTPPPLVPRTIMGAALQGASPSTGPEEAKRAREFSRWVNSEEFRLGAPNIRVFDFFDLLAEPADSQRNPNTLRQQYRSGRMGLDSHPNQCANIEVAPIFVDALWENIKSFERWKMQNLAAVS